MNEQLKDTSFLALDKMQQQQHDWVVSYNAALPSPCSHLLIVGPSHLATPLASALLRVQSQRSATTSTAFSSKPSKTTLPSALAALQRVYSSSAVMDPSDDIFLRQRQIHMSENWFDWMSSTTIRSSPRMDHVILVVSPNDVPGSQRLLLESKKCLHDDYLSYPRVSIVSMRLPTSLPVESIGEEPQKMGTTASLNGKLSSTTILPGVPVFVCWGPSPSSSLLGSSHRKRNQLDLDDEYDNLDGQQNEMTRSSLLVVARMVLQRAWIGTRRGNSQVSQTCPLIVSDHVVA